MRAQTSGGVLRGRTNHRRLAVRNRSAPNYNDTGQCANGEYPWNTEATSSSCSLESIVANGSLGTQKGNPYWRKRKGLRLVQKPSVLTRDTQSKGESHILYYSSLWGRFLNRQVKAEVSLNFSRISSCHWALMWLQSAMHRNWGKLQNPTAGLISHLLTIYGLFLYEK